MRLEDEATIKVASKKNAKEKPNGIIKLKKPAPKHSKPGNWKDGTVIDREWTAPKSPICCGSARKDILTLLR